MCRRSRVLCCCVFLLVATFSDSRRDFNNEDEQGGDSTVRRVFRANSKKDQSDKDESIRCNSGENSRKNHEVQDESRVNTTKDDCDDDDDSMGYDSRAPTVMNDEESNRMGLDSAKVSSTKATDENNFMSRPIHGNVTKTEGKDNHMIDDNKNTLPTKCKSDICIRLCCPLGHRLIHGECVPGTGDYTFPDVYTYTSDGSLQRENKSLDEISQLIVQDPCNFVCRRPKHFVFDPDKYVIFANGTLYMHSRNFSTTWFYCLAIVNRDVYDVIVCPCFIQYPISLSMTCVLSSLFLLVTFVVYTILPELQNMHGYILRAHVVSLLLTSLIFPIVQQTSSLELGDPACFLIAHLLTFSFMASFLWLNVIFFDIWWTFRELCPTEGNVKQQERKKFALYSIYAWGGSLLLVIICAIMDYVPDIPEYLIRPNHCGNDFFRLLWFGGNRSSKSKTLYFSIPASITILFNICFFVITLFKIIRYKRSTANNNLRNTESRRHYDNKQRFFMYVKLLIVVGISWSMEMEAELSAPLSYYNDVINSLQGITIFLVFVCRKKIKRLLSKRLGWKKCDPPDNNLTSNNAQSSTTTVSGTLNLQDIGTRTKTE